jgi:hypothetical protein
MPRLLNTESEQEREGARENYLFSAFFFVFYATGGVFWVMS